jgi:hypothetical protein
MSDELEDLVQDFYKYFLDLYHETADGTSADADGDAFLGFEPIGKSLTPAMFTLNTGDYSPQLAIERFSALANVVPDIDGTSIRGTIMNVDEQYEMLITAAKPLPDWDRTAFDHFRNAADQEFDQAKTPPMAPEGRTYRPAVATPPNWAAPDATTWTCRSFSRTHRTEVSATVGASAPQRPVGSWAWRVAPENLRAAVVNHRAMQATLVSERMVHPAAQPAQANLAAAAVASQRMMRAPGGGGMAFRTMAAAPVAPARAQMMASRVHLAEVREVRPGLFVHPVEEARNVRPEIVEQRAAEGINVGPDLPLHEAPEEVRPEVLAVHAQELAATSTVQQVTSSNLELSFDYCLVNIGRPWLSSSFLALKGWYLQGTKAGELASGTGTTEAPMEVIPRAAIVVRNLSIKADWSNTDATSLQSFVKLGPFSLIGRTIDTATNTLHCAGMQIVAWVCEPMPFLPPASDPEVH